MLCNVSPVASVPFQNMIQGIDIVGSHFHLHIGNFHGGKWHSVWEVRSMLSFIVTWC